MVLGEVRLLEAKTYKIGFGYVHCSMYVIVKVICQTLRRFIDGLMLDLCLLALQR